MTKKSKKPKLLRRYTELSAVIDILLNKRIVFLSPSLWDDKNDTHFLQKYKEERKATALLALCVSSMGETYHHWRVFCGHSSGVCIEFLRDDLMKLSKATPGVRSGRVRYMILPEIEREIANKKLELSELPFVKRHAFRHEQEFRFIYESRDASELGKNAHYVDIPLGIIHRICLSPWMPLPLFDAAKQVLNKIPGCKSISIVRSDLIENERWKRNANSFKP